MQDDAAAVDLVRAYLHDHGIRMFKSYDMAPDGTLHLSPIFIRFDGTTASIRYSGAVKKDYDLHDPNSLPQILEDLKHCWLLG